ncbi:MAG: class I SAM-dependent rRNA methyltransferase [Flavobacteriales bacterium]|nr:class I SAM-dependent rRNA methyltransferase [Flavobacteriales bacterium]MCX7768996.1 class I SAM-dependent rRNA methyltransferase [Flavobacteriales bacterium]MDW8410823.1 class I SAM-dependent rRNA methyltransferase [Flavobacteriales bacterium]
MSAPLVLHLKPGREDSVIRRHPWIFSGALRENTDGLEEGAWVFIHNFQDQPIAAGYYCGGSIAVRIVLFGAELSDGETAIRRRVEEALACRRQLGFEPAPHTAFRLLNGEGDLLPGIVADWYDGIVVVQLHHRAACYWRDLITKSLQDNLGSALRHVIVTEAWQSSKNSETQSSEAANQVRVLEHGLWYLVKPGQGQKTGFYLDQRSNRLLVRHLSSGRRVLNLFSFTGGFSLNALAGGASFVRSVDSSAQALQVLREQLELNGLPSVRHDCAEADIFRWIHTHDERYDLVICDPPALAHSLLSRHTAIQSYKRLNQGALLRVQPGGLLCTFSCTAVVSESQFEGAVRAAAIATGRSVRVLRHLGPDLDHPWLLTHPEGRYLKGFLLQVD